MSPEEITSKPAIFLDRDGVINHDSGYVHKVEELVLLPEVGESLKKFKSNGYLLLVITNQSGVARGYFDLQDVYAFHDHINTQLSNKFQVKIDDFFICPHHKSGSIEKYSHECNCRKPKTQLAEEAIRKWNVNLESSFMIGDKSSDIQLGVNLNIPGIQIINGQYNVDSAAKFSCSNLKQAAEFIIGSD